MPAKLKLSPVNSSLTEDESHSVHVFRDMAVSLGVTSTDELGRAVRYNRTHVWRMLHGHKDTLPSEEALQRLRELVPDPRYSGADIKKLVHNAKVAKRERRIRETRHEQKLALTSDAAPATSGGRPAAGSEPSGNSSLPVPRSARDRQRSAQSTPSTNTQQFVERAATLEANPAELLSVVRIAAGEFTAYEGAVALHLLKEGQHDSVAAPFLEIYTQDRACSAVMETAVVLLDEFHMSNLASTVLHAALKSRAGKE